MRSGLGTIIAVLAALSSAGLVTPGRAEQATEATVEISCLGISDEIGLLRRPAARGERIRGVGVVNNNTSADLPLHWQMLLDGTIVSSGSWTIPAGGTAVTSSATTEAISPGTHMLALMVAQGSAIVSQDIVNFEVKEATSARH